MLRLFDEDTRLNVAPKAAFRLSSRPRMRSDAVIVPLSVLLCLSAASRPAAAEPDEVSAAATASSKDPGFSPDLVLESGRIEPPPAEVDSITFTVRGEYQLRYRALSDLRLEPPQGEPLRNELGQNQYVYHWLRLTPRLQVRKTLAVVGQIDLARGLVVGDKTTLVDKTRDPLNEDRWYEVHPRYLYVEWTSPIGLFRLGQQGSYWGMGILANDGDHRSLFGDYQRGALTERLLFATQPLGKGSPLSIAIAGDFVFEDNQADLLDDHDRALQAVLAVLWKTKRAELGVYGVLRSQSRGSQDPTQMTPFTEGLQAGVIDVSAKVNGQAPGSQAYVYAEAEAAAIFGSTTFVRSAYDATAAPSPDHAPEVIRAFGAAATVGVTRASGRGRDRFGRFAAEVEWGYASGDADPFDGASSRFTFDRNHNVGLILFNQALAWKTARAATLAQDPRLVRRPAPGLSLLPTKGGVAGATYLNPRAVVRPKKWLDLKAGVVLAQTTSDFVDPYHAGVLGSYASYDGGDERSHDLGLEVDLGLDARVDVSHLVNLDFGAEGGALFSGRAFDDAAGEGLGTVYMGSIKIGVNF